ncbi:Z1 domain-containing protein [Corynebacterium hansenii]|uniref:Z1 domain-containing protein n=1 Tax=Corynebacterium hansenii TaxID=394964 RepID=A0ABV7ZRC6_9CORY|nr:Z1 domain-containing protein [Corynebacterium hansenii]WJY99831.1 Z1 domain protein [Corynebacterium hansenii]
MTNQGLTTSTFTDLREAIDTVLQTRRIVLTITLFDNINLQLDEDYSFKDLQNYVKCGTDADIAPLISFIMAAEAADGAAIKPKTDTEPGTHDRREWIIKRLGLTDLTEDLATRLPVKERTTVIDKDFVDWYKGERRTANANYWTIYEEVLKGKGWGADSITTVGNQATEVIRRLDDPLGPPRGGKRGLVVGYVQSGKTANFTAVIAKAIDAGYRFVVVLAGTLDILRTQTQRRLDMELFGKEAILDGRNEEDLTAFDLKAESYFDDDSDWDLDWDTERRGFVKHGGALGSAGYPKIRRLTTSHQDYVGSTGASNLDVVLHNRALPFNNPDNLLHSRTYVAVVKKNSKVLGKLNSDLKRLDPTIVQDLSVLIIDDESDQASINTIKPKKSSKEEVERTAVNRQIIDLLKFFPRSQYVGYTATPFANVFVNPDDPEDLYPRDFALMLSEPPAYRGAAWFHDRHERFEDDPEPTVENSRSMAFIRDIAESPTSSNDEPDPVFEEVRREEIQEALDMFVLTGAVKKYREKNSSLRFAHHTMLIHEAVDTATHEEAWALLKTLWEQSNYAEGGRDKELRELFDKNLKPVMDVKKYADGAPVPATFEDLKPDVFTNHITEAVQMMMGYSSEPPILQVNSVGGDEVDFERSSVWKVLVGGTKLSRGYTVEGLTVSYFRRRAGSADTLMQTGRWFGFRKGYQDLVRLYAPPTLVDMFEASMADENHFRTMLKAYAQLDKDGRAEVTPRDLPILVRQSLPDLSPTSANKMFNAYIKSTASAPNITDFNQVPAKDAIDHKRANIENFAIPLISGMKNETHDLAFVRYENSRAGDGIKVTAGYTPSYTAVVSSRELVDRLEQAYWYDDEDDERGNYYNNVVAPRLQYLKDLMGLDPDGDGPDSRFTETAVIVANPKSKSTPGIDLPGVKFRVPILRRARRTGTGRNDIIGSDRKHSYALESVAAGLPATYPRNEDWGHLSDKKRREFDTHPTSFRVDPTAEPFELDSAARHTRGAILLTFFDDREEDDVAEMYRKHGRIRWSPPDFRKGEVGVQISLNSPHAPISAQGHDAIVWGVHVPAKRDKPTVSKAEVKAEASS